MPQLFILAADNTVTREHLAKAMERPIADEIILDSFDETHHQELLRVREQAGGFYAWGLPHSPANEAEWNALAVGDYVLCVFDNSYRFASRVLYKCDSMVTAEKVWGKNDSDSTWQYMFFLSQPVKINRSVADLKDELDPTYTNLTRIAENDVLSMVDRYGSIEAFIEQQTAIRVTSISVTSLFGLFDHTIPLNLEERTTIIHGPNGFGKTILLQMLDGLFNRRYKILRTTPFEELKVEFDNGGVVVVRKTARTLGTQQDELDDFEDLGLVGKDWHEQPVEVAVHYSSPKAGKLKPFHIHSFNRAKGARIPASMLERRIPGLRRVASDRWIHHSLGETLSFDDVLERFGHRLPYRPVRPPVWLTDLQRRVDVQLIETQRLLRRKAPDREAEVYPRGEPEFVPMIKSHSAELAQRIQSKLAESASLSQSLDRSFPFRLVEQAGLRKLTVDQLRKKLGDLEKKRNQLKEVGLLVGEQDIAFMPNDETIRSTKDVLAVYAQDADEKLSVFDELAKKLTLFRDILNQRFLYKQVTISKEDGFVFHGQDQRPLPLDALSSGEQHEVILLYYLLFRVAPNALVLIDEPELSLHVAWQRQFLRDLRRVTELASFDVLVATHSPQIIHDQWDLTVDLKAPAQA